MYKSLIPTLKRVLAAAPSKASAAGIVVPVTKVCGCSESWTSAAFNFFFRREEPRYPFSLVADELSKITDYISSNLVSKYPKLTSAAQYFFKEGVQGNQVRPTILLLMAKSLSMRAPEPTLNGLSDGLTSEQLLVIVIEMIHVASQMHEDVQDNPDTGSGIGSLNTLLMNNKHTILGGDFLHAGALRLFASMNDTEFLQVNSLLLTAMEEEMTGKVMQMDCTLEQLCSMEFYMEKTYYKTASLMANSCKAIALLAGQTTEVQMLAFEYGKNLGLTFQLIDDLLDYTGKSASLGKGSLSDIHAGIVTAPILYAMEEFPQLRKIIDQGIDNAKNIEIALEYLRKSNGLQRTRELASAHANLAIAAIDSLPAATDDEQAQKRRKALKDLAVKLVTRDK